ncbi:MAG: PAS domain S-box protein [Planctomycetes bacterium]|nr:PAS domain S-box protein [Planctomycetota bacterium]
MTAKQLLVIDDNKDDFLLISRLVGSEYQIAYSDGDDAIVGLIEEHVPDCVMLDYHLTTETGIEHLREVKSNTSVAHVPVIMMTGEKNPDVIVDCMKSGAADYLCKGDLGKEEILNKIHRAVENAELHAKVNEQQNRLKESEERFQHLLASSAAVIYSLSLQGEAIELSFMSENIEDILGYKPREISNIQLAQSIVHPEDLPSIKARILTMLERKTASTLEYRARHKNGSYKWLRDTNRPVFDSDDQLVEIIGSWIDITERKQLDKALMASQQQYEMISENINDVIWLFNISELQISFCTSSVVRVSGFTSEETISLPLDKFFPPESLERLMKYLDEAIKEAGTKKDVVGRTRLQAYHKDGSLFWEEISARLIRDEKGKPTDILGISRDVTERKRAEEHLESLNHGLKRVGRTNAL